MSYSSIDLNGDLRPLLHALWAEMGVLSRTVDGIQRPIPSSEEASQTADRLLAANEALPGRIARATGAAMREQHRAALAELGVIRVQMAADADAIHEELKQRTSSSDRILEEVAAAMKEQHTSVLAELGALRAQTAADADALWVRMATDAQALKEELQQHRRGMVEAFDARFKWLLGELSERLIIFGNQLVRINRHLEAPDPTSSKVQADLKGTLERMVVEVDRLSQALDSLHLDSVAATKSG